MATYSERLERLASVLANNDNFLEVHEESITNYLIAGNHLIDGGNEVFEVTVIGRDIIDVELQEYYSINIFFTFENKTYCFEFYCDSFDEIRLTEYYEVRNFIPLSYDIIKGDD